MRKLKINWKARLKNKVFLISLGTLIISVAYKALAMFDVFPNVSESETLEILSYFVDVLSIMGIVIDPTTDGVNDSDRALTYGTDEDVRYLESAEEYVEEEVE